MKMRFIPVVLLALLGHSSQAQIYRCSEPGGREVYNEKGGPDCTLLYPDRTERTPPPAGLPPSPPSQEEGAADPEGTSLTFVDNTSDVVGQQVLARGAVRNNGVHPLRSVRIVVECYDGEGEMVATGSSLTVPEHIPPGGTGEYEITVEHDPRMKRVKTVARWSEEEEQPTTRGTD